MQYLHFFMFYLILLNSIISPRPLKCWLKYWFYLFFLHNCNPFTRIRINLIFKSLSEVKQKLPIFHKLKNKNHVIVKSLESSNLVTETVLFLPLIFKISTTILDISIYDSRAITVHVQYSHNVHTFMINLTNNCNLITVDLNNRR